MRLLIICTALAALLIAAPSRAEELRDTAQVLSDCVVRFKAENGMTDGDLSRLQAGQTYRVYGREYLLQAGGTATDVCKLAEFDQLGARLDRAVAAATASAGQVTAANLRAGEFERRLAQYERPLGLDLPWLAAVLTWIRSHPIAVAIYMLVTTTYVLAHWWDITPWGQQQRARAKARARSGRKRWWKWPLRILVGLVGLGSILIIMAFAVMR